MASSVHAAHSPYSAHADPYIRAVSDHVIQQEIAAQRTDPFTGDPVCFWALIGRMKENVENFR